jgi:hypothetical protein
MPSWMQAALLPRAAESLRRAMIVALSVVVSSAPISSMAL